MKIAKKIMSDPTVLILSLGLFTIGLVVPAYAMTESFSEPDGWEFVSHGTLITIDGHLDGYTNNGKTDHLAVTLQNSAGQTLGPLTFNEGGDTGIFTFPTYILFTNSSTSIATPRIHVNVDDSHSDTVSFSSINSSLGFIQKSITVNSEKFGSFVGWTAEPLTPTQKKIKISCGANGDLDLDGICDSFETTNGLQIHNPSDPAGNTYTYPCSRLLDYPANPINDDVNNPVTCPSPATNHKDIYVEIDYLKHHAPNNNALLNVIKAFKNHSIFLHLQVDEEVPYHRYAISGPGAGGAGGTDFDTIKNSFFGTSADRSPAGPITETQLLIDKRQVFHYTLFSHSSTTGFSGLSETPGNDMGIFLGNWTGGVGSLDDQAGTFMHELGHNLKLYHGGVFPSAHYPYDNTNCKPNYLSVMNYADQFTNLVTNRPLDYSSGIASPITEAGTLFESTGIGAGPSGMTTAWGNNTGQGITGVAGGWLDWNHDTQHTPDQVAPPGIDLNKINLVGCDGSQVNPADTGSTQTPSSGPATFPFNDSNDWTNLVLDEKINTGFNDGAPAANTPDIPTTIIKPDGTNETITTAYGGSSSSIILPPYSQSLHTTLVSYVMPIVGKIKDNNSKSCECTDKNSPLNLLAANGNANYEKLLAKYAHPLYDPDHPDKLDKSANSTYFPDATKNQTLNMSIQLVNATDNYIQNLPTCAFSANSTYQNSQMCSDDAESAKKILHEGLAAINGLIMDDGLYGATQKLQEARANATELIQNPVARAEAVNKLDNSLQSLQTVTAAAQPQYFTFEQKYSDLFVALLIGVTIALIAALIVFVILWYKSRRGAGKVVVERR
ncbi:MAG: hypothetical protein AUI92_04535 [Thaumarchaeota archaeon 13_1_40CM_3_38_6]|nr:MAG: hypothetical protein AUI92_04535 [Thaumarchaeota archaeon 13_1_40CM_3_38_6]